MDIETQLQFINEEIALCDVRKAKLEAIRDTLTNKIAPIVASLNAIKIENDSLKIEKVELQNQLDVKPTTEEIIM